MAIFEQKLSFRMFSNAREGLEVLQALQWIHGGALMRVQGVQSLFAFFTY